jgi:predicted HD phosphohydrolase
LNKRSTPDVPEMIRRWLRALRSEVRGRAVNQLEHALQAATLAAKAGADDELVVAALCHDLGKALSWEGHPTLSARILSAYLAPAHVALVRFHQDFLAIYNVNYSGVDPSMFRAKHQGKSWYGAAVRFADEWDHPAYDPDRKTRRLSYFSPLLDRVFAEPRRDVASVDFMLRLDAKIRR